MAGITSIGAYIPMYRLGQEEIGRMWRTRGMGGEKAVAGYDEDSVTMGVAAAQDCIRRSSSEPKSLYFATTTGPYKEKQHAAIMATVLDLERTARTVDITNSLRGGTTSLNAALDAVQAGTSTDALVVASDCRMGAPKGRFEQLLGDSAAAVMVGSKDPIAEIESTYSIYSDFTDLWRTEADTFLRSGEGRFIEEAGYMPIMQGAISELMKRAGTVPADLSKIAFYAPDQKQHADLAKKLGFEAAQVQDPLFKSIGNTGAPGVLITFAQALLEARPNDRILVAGYGDGVDAFIFRVTERIGQMRQGSTIAEMLGRKRNIDYATYLTWRGLVPMEASNLPEREEPSLASRWRERKVIASLYGVKCTKCGTPQVHSIGQNLRICTACQAKDQFEPYRFSDKRGKLFTYAIDHLQPTKNPPGVNGVVDFDGGGRFMCELTDCDPASIKIGMTVEMTFRRLPGSENIANYFWKAKPV